MIRVISSPSISTIGFLATTLDPSVPRIPISPSSYQARPSLDHGWAAWQGVGEPGRRHWFNEPVPGLPRLPWRTGTGTRLRRMRIGVPREIAARETRVALVPDTVARLVKSGLEVLVEAGAGERATFGDDAYQGAGARLAPGPRELWGGTDLVLSVRAPQRDPSLGVHQIELMREGASLIGFLRPV